MPLSKAELVAEDKNEDPSDTAELADADADSDKVELDDDGDA